MIGLIGINARGDHRNPHHPFQGRIQSGADNNIRVWIDLFANPIGRFVQLKQGQISAASDVVSSLSCTLAIPLSLGPSCGKAAPDAMRGEGRPRMQIGFNAPTAGPLATPEAITRLLQGGEAMGYAYATFSDHVVIPTDIHAIYPYSDNGEFPAGARGAWKP